MAEFDAAKLARKYGGWLLIGADLRPASEAISAITEAHAAGRAEGLRWAVEIARQAPNNGGAYIAKRIESELEATNGK